MSAGVIDAVTLVRLVEEARLMGETVVRHRLENGAVVEVHLVPRGDIPGISIPTISAREGQPTQPTR
jgi:hypothetical protein